MNRLIFTLAFLVVFNKLKSQIRHPDYWDTKRMIDSPRTNEIDPRQYVRVLYKKNPNYKQKEGIETQRLIWNWNDTGYFQKFKVLDNEGILNIFFKKEELAQNIRFTGNLSLEAYIKGKDGERKIEIQPYSLVGVDRTEIGIKSYPATTIAQLLFNTILEMKRTISTLNFTNYNKTLSQLYDDYDDFTVLNEILSLIEKDHASELNQPIDSSESFLKTIKYYVYGDTIKFFNGKDSVTYYEELKKYTNNAKNYKYKDLIRDLKYVLSDFRYYLIRESMEFKKGLKTLSERLMLINSYLNSFERAGNDAVKAFLELASKDKINFKYLREKLARQEEQINILLNSFEKSKNPLLLVDSRDNLDLVISIIDILERFSSIEGSTMDSIIETYVKSSDIIKKEPEILNELNQQFQGVQYNDFRANLFYDQDGEVLNNNYSSFVRLRVLEKSDLFNTFKEKLSIYAANIIYRKLVFATIDLAKSGAQEGDILYLNVVWKNIDQRDDSASSEYSLLPIGRYYLKETGWKTKISESFYLVERINEPSNDPNLSKSNFKGAYGASIMRTFYYNENYERTFGGRFLNWLQPSIGFNISYLDFYTNKDIEIGAALQLGLFKNVFFFGSGINLHSIRGDEKKSAAFFMFGISFTNIAAKFKNNNDDGNISK